MKSYFDQPLLDSTRILYSRYKSGHVLFDKWMREKHKTIEKSSTDNLILNSIGDRKSLWIDSFGHCFKVYNPNIISIEGIHNANLLKGIPYVYFRANLQNIETHHELAETFKPEIIVSYRTEIFKYLTIPKLIKKIFDLKNIYNAELCIYMDLQFIDYNKLKYPITYIIDEIRQQLPNATVNRLHNATLKRLVLTELLINI